MILRDETLPHQGTAQWAPRNYYVKGSTSHIQMVCNCGWRSQAVRPENPATLRYITTAYRAHITESAEAVS